MSFMAGFNPIMGMVFAGGVSAVEIEEIDRSKAASKELADLDIDVSPLSASESIIITLLMSIATERGGQEGDGHK